MDSVFNMDLGDFSSNTTVSRIYKDLFQTYGKIFEMHNSNT